MKYLITLICLMCVSNIYSQSSVSVNTDQTVSINGNKFFPISVYVQSDYTGIKNMGVNTASRPFCVNDGAFNSIESNQLYCHYTAGPGCDYENATAIKNRNASPFTQSINKVKNSNYIFGYGLPDEPKSATNLSAADAEWAYNVYKAADPNHPVFLTEYSSDISAYKNAADIFLNDLYPYNNISNPLYSIKTKLKNMQAQVAPKPVWLIIQTGSQFGMPTNEQIRAETYLSIALGSTGLIFYSYDVEDAGGVNNIKKDGDLSFMTNLISELKDFSPVFLGAKNNSLSYNSDDVDAILKDYNGKSYLIAVNKSSSAKSITFSLNGFSNATAKAVGLASAGSSRVGQTKAISSGSLSDTLQGLEVVIYEISQNQCTVPAQPGAISGSANVTAGTSQSYSVGTVSGATSYTWTLPSGWSGSSTSSTINVTAGNEGGTISVKASNSCGASAASTFNVAVVGGEANLALDKPVTASTIESAELDVTKAVDGNYDSRWASAETDDEWIYVDLGNTYDINRVKISWEVAYGKDYLIQTSNDAISWTTIKAVSGNTSLSNDFSGLTGTGRYVRMYGTARGTIYGYSIYELEVYGSPVDEIDADAATLYLHCSYDGTSAVITEGSYHLSDFTYLGGGTYFLSSLKIKDGYQVTLYSNADFSGETLVLNADNLCLVDEGWNDKAASLVVSKISRQSGALELVSGSKENNELVAVSAFKVYPNPAEQSVSIDFKGNKASVKIIDTLGNEVLSINDVERKQTLDISALKTGVYFIQITQDEQSETMRMIVK